MLGILHDDDDTTCAIWSHSHCLSIHSNLSICLWYSIIILSKACLFIFPFQSPTRVISCQLVYLLSRLKSPFYTQVPAAYKFPFGPQVLLLPTSPYAPFCPCMPMSWHLNPSIFIYHACLHLLVPFSLPAHSNRSIHLVQFLYPGCCNEFTGLDMKKRFVIKNFLVVRHHCVSSWEAMVCGVFVNSG